MCVTGFERWSRESLWLSSETVTVQLLKLSWAGGGGGGELVTSWGSLATVCRLFPGRCSSSRHQIDEREKWALVSPLSRMIWLFTTDQFVGKESARVPSYRPQDVSSVVLRPSRLRGADYFQVADISPSRMFEGISCVDFAGKPSLFPKLTFGLRTWCCYCADA